MAFTGPPIGRPTEPQQIIAHAAGRAITRLDVWELATRMTGGAHELARKVGTTPRTVFRWIHGKQSTRRGVNWPVSVKLGELFREPPQR